MKFGCKYLKQVDLFSQPFSFAFENDEKKKKTQAGGILSCLIYTLLLGYFTYLCYLYFTSQINPSISQNTMLYDQNSTLNITNDIFAFQLKLPNGQNLKQLQQSTGLIYLNVLPTYNYLDEKGVSQKKILNFMNCSDPTLSQYTCLDFTAAGISQTNLIMPFDPNKIGSYSINLLFIACNPQFLQANQQCATYKQIRQQILRIQTQGVMRISTSQFNPKTKKYDRNIKQEIFGLSEGLALSSQIILQQSTTKVTEGFLLQNDSETIHLSDYQRQDQYLPSQFIQDELQMNIISLVRIYIGQNGMKQQIQFPPFTQILAQFSSVVNIILISGIFISAYAQKQIVEDLINIQLKTYFKKTTFSLIQKQQKKLPEDQQSLSQRLVNAYKYIKLKVYFYDSQVKKQDSNQLIRYKKVYQEAEKSMSIFEIQKQLLQIKMMLRILFSAEQFAAIQLCGKEILQSEFYYKLYEVTQTNNQDVDSKQQKKESQNKYEKYKINSQKNQKAKKSIFNTLESESYSPNQNFILDSNTVNINNYNLDSQKIDNTKEQELQSNEQAADTGLSSVSQGKNSERNNIQQTQQGIASAQNHLEKIDLIESDLDYFQTYLEKFLDKSYVKSDLDYRILNCMINVDKEDDIEIK
ncbi:hypothetical protein ABPG74_009622 [Tetrahymena malaccensis]